MQNFITIEGPDGAGKTTILDSLKPWLEQNCNRPVLYTREPGGDQISEQIRSVILDPKNTQMDVHTELLLYEAARSQLVAEIIKPALDDGQLVVCDRYTDSTLAYQGGGNHIDLKIIDELNNFATHDIKPGLTIFFDVPVEVGLGRINQFRQGKDDRLDQKDVSYHQIVRDTYHQVVKQFPDRIQTIDGTQSIAKRIADSKKLIMQRFPDLFK